MLETERPLLRRPSTGDGKFEVGLRGDGVVAPETWQPSAGPVSLIPPDNLPSQTVARRPGAVPGREVHLPRDETFVIWEH